MVGSSPPSSSGSSRTISSTRSRSTSRPGEAGAWVDACSSSWPSRFRAISERDARCRLPGDRLARAQNVHLLLDAAPLRFPEEAVGRLSERLAIHREGAPVHRHQKPAPNVFEELD